MSTACTSRISLALLRQLPPARIRCSEILDRIEALICEELEDACEQAGVDSKIGGQISDILIDAIVEARTLLGDDLLDDEWFVAANEPKTREQVADETRERVESGTREAAGDGR